MHLLEKAAHEDPFLEDALEGFELRKENLTGDSADLKQRFRLLLKSKTEKGARIIGMQNWFKAAAIVVLAVTGSVIFYSIVFDTEPQLADTSTQELKVHEADTTSKPEIVQETAPAPSVAAADEADSNNDLAARNNNSANYRIQAFKQNAGLPVQNDETAETDNTKVLTKTNPEISAIREEDNLRRKKIAEGQPEKDSLTQVDSGIISSITAADAVARKDSPTVAKKAEINPVALQNSEVVANAVPKNGWDAFQKYVENNSRLKKPETELESVISFTINKNGRLKSFRVEKSAGKNYDAEAIRLIRKGPKWQLTPGTKEARVTVPIKF